MKWMLISSGFTYESPEYPSAHAQVGVVWFVASLENSLHTTVPPFWQTNSAHKATIGSIRFLNSHAAFSMDGSHSQWRSFQRSMHFPPRGHGRSRHESWARQPYSTPFIFSMFTIRFRSRVEWIFNTGNNGNKWRPKRTSSRQPMKSPPSCT